MSSTLFGLAAAIADATRPHLPEGARVDACDPAKNRDYDNGSLWVHRIRVASAIRSLGDGPAATHGNRDENTTVELRAGAYSQDKHHDDAAAAAWAIVEQLVQALVDAIEAEDPGDLSFGHFDGWSELTTVDYRLHPAPDGWTVTADITVTCHRRTA